MSARPKKKKETRGRKFLGFTERIAVNLSPSQITALDEAAKQDRRTRSDFLRVVVIEALIARGVYTDDE